MTFRPILFVMLIASCLICAQNASAQDAKPAAATWQDAARESGLSAEDIAALESNRILITNNACKQVFSPYIDNDKPLFITTDSLLNAYHVLYEESILRLETSMAEQMPSILRLILKNIKDADDQLTGNPELVSAAKRHAMIVTGIALKLTDDSFQFEDDALNKILSEETALIVKAEGTRFPEWLGNPDRTFTALDYSRYMPRGFYTRSETLQGYFRAVSWLQSIPFRVQKDEELLAILMLGESASNRRFDDSGKSHGIYNFIRAYRAFIGGGDDWDLMTAMEAIPDGLVMKLDGDDLQEKRAALMKQAEENGNGPLINDQLRFPSEDPSRRAAEPNFRIISAYRTPSAILFHRTTNTPGAQRSWPDGLEVSAALGSSFARKQLKDKQLEETLKEIDACKAYFRGNSLYLQYLDMLRTLLDAPEKDAPDFMKNKAWEIKSCNTALAGWSQLRHTWALQAKQTVHYLGMSSVPEGFVEPEPEFYAKMAELANNTKLQLRQAGAMKRNYKRTLPTIENMSLLLGEVKSLMDFTEKLHTMVRAGKIDYDLSHRLMYANKTKTEEYTEAYFKEQKQWFDTLTADIKNGQIDKHPKIKRLLLSYEFDLESSWNQLAGLSRRLEGLSYKQLRNVDLDKSDAAFIRGYGQSIARIMFYGGNAYLSPKDDAPRVVDVYQNPNANAYLHVGIARPRKMYVLYPWKGKSVFCEGAVMPYYEFVNSSRLTDASWKKMLDSDQRPSIPEWMVPIISGGNLSKASHDKDH